MKEKETISYATIARNLDIQMKGATESLVSLQTLSSLKTRGFRMEYKVILYSQQMIMQINQWLMQKRVLLKNSTITVTPPFYPYP